MTIDTGNNDNRVTKPIYFSGFSEHFQGDFPLFLNRYEEGFELKEHHHAYLEMVYVASGDGYHYVGNAIEKTGKGRLYVLPVGTSHLFRPASSSNANKLLVYNLCVRPEFIAELKSTFQGYGSVDAWTHLEGTPGSYVSLVDPNRELGTLFEHLLREFTEKPDGYETSLYAGLLNLIVRIRRLIEAKDLGGNPDARRRNGNAEILRILHGISHRIADPLTVEDLAAESGMSARNFIRLFRKHTGMGFSRYLQHKRIEQACYLLRESDDKIASIAKSVGYRDSTHFRETFRNIIGVSPSAFRGSRNEEAPGS